MPTLVFIMGGVYVFYSEGSIWSLPVRLQLFSADLTQLITDHQAHRQPPSLLTQCLTSSPFTPRYSIQQPLHAPPVNPPRHHRTEMAKTAIGEFCTSSIFSFFLWAASQVWCCEAVATPMAQKDAEGWWEGAAKLLCKSVKSSCVTEAAFSSSSPFLRVIFVPFFVGPKSKLSLINMSQFGIQMTVSVTHIFIHPKQENKKKWIHIERRKAYFFLSSRSSILSMPACRTCLLSPDSEPCGIMQLQRPHPTSPVPSKRARRPLGCEIFSPWQISLLKTGPSYVVGV